MFCFRFISHVFGGINSPKKLSISEENLNVFYDMDPTEIPSQVPGWLTPLRLGSSLISGWKKHLVYNIISNDVAKFIYRVGSISRFRLHFRAFQLLVPKASLAIIVPTIN
ncbi:hypothetical protein RF11_01635 [Thelohanellus kitauei]|uniref:Uncharacterized protein n=1 Tax=Thelohanellus kitauei TaxID=669202 RepID=A0A0C2MSA7_THEKT|nr:hypothetical protein RF11_03926 [Thelohanellus kitauei]KII70181.1 hypothetical protein RF11_01635 [Thelohanellus kitauei]